MKQKEKELSPLEKANITEIDRATVQATAGEIIDAFEQVDSEKLQGLTTEYLQLKEDTTYNMVFTAVTEFTGENGGSVRAVELVDKEGNKFINGNTVLVNSLSKVTDMPCLVRIVTGKKIKSSNVKGGQYLAMDVFVLPKAVQK